MCGENERTMNLERLREELRDVFAGNERVDVQIVRQLMISYQANDWEQYSHFDTR